MRRYCGQPWWSTADFMTSPGSFCQVELRGLEPLTPAYKATYTLVLAALTWLVSCL
jgi:hypothetical protein